MARLACGASRRAASDRARLASARLSPVLGMEEPTSHGAAGRANRCPRIDSRDVHSKSTLGHTSDSRRAPQVGDLRKSVDGRDVHAAASAAAVPNVADLPHQSCEPDHGCRPVRRAHRDVPALFVLMILAHDRRRIVHVAITDHRPRPGRHNSCAMHFRKRRTSVSTARSRFGLCRRGDHHRGHEYSRRSYGTAIAEAERVRGTGHRLDPTRVPRSRHRDERGGTAADPQRLHRVLHAVADPSRA